MNRLLNSLVWILAGALILISVWLSQLVSQWWLLLTFLVSAYLVVSGITGHDPVRNYLRKQLGEAGNDEDED
jgi:fatty acid desaturase